MENDLYVDIFAALLWVCVVNHHSAGLGMSLIFFVLFTKQRDLVLALAVLFFLNVPDMAPALPPS